MGKIRIGVVGCANIAFRSVIPAILTIRDFELVAVASRADPQAQKFADAFGCEAMTGYQHLLDRSDIDAIYMPLPTGLHGEWVTKALEAGKHVMAEKSFAMCHSEALQMVRIATERNLLIMENFMFCYHHQHKFVQTLINKGEIGEIRVFRSSFGFPPLAEGNFRYDLELGGGSLLDAAAYTVKASQFFLGSALEVKASTLVRNKNGVDIHGGAYLSTPNNLISEIGFGFDNFYQCNYEIWGSKGKITADRAFTPGSDFKPRIILEKQGEKKEFFIEPENHFMKILQEFIRAIREGDYAVHYEETLNQSRLLDQIREKAE